MTTENQETKSQPSARDAAIEAMAQASHARMLAELGEPQDVADNDEPAPAPVAEPLDTAEPVDPAAEKPEDQVAKQMRKVKVDGHEIEVSDDDLVASYRQQETTRRAMAQALQDRAEAARLLAETRAAVVAKPAEPAPDRSEKIKEYHDAMVNGDLETANRLFDEVMTSGRQEPPLSVDDIVQRATPVLKQALKQELSNESALEKFSTDFKDIIDDPILTEVTKVRLHARMAEGQPYAEALFEAGGETRNWMKSKGASVPTEQPTTTRAEKLEKKAGIISFPTAHTKATSTAEPEQTTTDIIAEMRKRRGQG